MNNQSRVTIHESRLPWFVIKTKPLAEEDVKTRLTRAHFEVFLPRIRTIMRGHLKPVSRLKSLFPSYLFARLNLDDAEVFHMIKYTRGVHKILGNGTIPVPIPEDVVDCIRERVNKEDVLEQALVFKKGDSVRICRGPLRDLIGILEKPVSSAGRVRVLLQIMHKVVRAELSCSEIERTST